MESVLLLSCLRTLPVLGHLDPEHTKLKHPIAGHADSDQADLGHLDQEDTYLERTVAGYIDSEHSDLNHLDPDHTNTEPDSPEYADPEHPDLKYTNPEHADLEQQYPDHHHRVNPDPEYVSRENLNPPQQNPKHARLEHQNLQNPELSDFRNLELPDLELKLIWSRILDLISEAHTGVKGIIRDYAGRPFNGALVKVLQGPVL